jgi:RimJ/RimL family protein N-acetyltransferase
MSDIPTDLTVRPLRGPDELDLFCRLPYVLNPELAGDLAAGRRHPEWMWLALRGDHVVARLAWWAPGDTRTPALLDIVDLDDDAAPDLSIVDVGVHLVRTAMAGTLPAGPRPEYLRFLAPDWRGDPRARRAVADRTEVLGATGARPLVERLRLRWSPDTPVPVPAGRLRLTPAPDRAELVGLMTRVLTGTLDAHSLRELARMPAHRAAEEQYDGELSRYPSPREWWRVGRRGDGEPVGFVIPARNSYHAIIAYIGVVPEHRGHGFVDELLAAGTSLLAAQGVAQIRAATDIGNRPMAAAFARAGYVVFEEQITMVWD